MVYHESTDAVALRATASESENIWKVMDSIEKAHSKRFSATSSKSNACAISD